MQLTCLDRSECHSHSWQADRSGLGLLLLLSSGEQKFRIDFKMVLIMYNTLPEQVLTHIRSSFNYSLLSLSSSDQTWVCDIDIRNTLVTTAC